MKILFLGTFFPSNETDIINKNSKKSVQNASNILQWDYINGFEYLYEKNFSLLTKMCIGTFPNKYKKMFIESKKFKSESGTTGISVGFPNFYPVKQFIYPKVCYKYIKKWIIENKDEKKVLIAYSALNALELIKIKKKYKDLRIALIIPDLPCYMNLDKNNIIYRLKKQHEMNILDKCLKHIDVIVPITSYMGNFLNKNHQLESIVIEGMINSKKQHISHKYKNYFSFCYCGTLTKKYGVLDLIKSFRSINNKNIRLIICGAGELTNEIKKAALEDSRIIYKGIVSSNEAYEIQCKSDVLINPRKNDDEYTKYSFPSKILQYMKTGRPILCYKLDGIPKEYDDYLLYINNEETLKDKMEYVLKINHSKLDEIGVKSQRFVFDQKNNIEQVKKIAKILGE